MLALAGTISEVVAYDVALDEFFEPNSLASLEYARGKQLAADEIAAGFIVIGVNDDAADLTIGDVQCFAAPCSPIVRRADVGIFEREQILASHQVPDVNVSGDRSSLWPWLAVAAAIVWGISQ